MNSKLVFSLTLCIQTLLTVGHAADRTSGKMFATRSEVVGQHGMVATSHTLATQVGNGEKWRREGDSNPR